MTELPNKRTSALLRTLAPLVVAALASACAAPSEGDQDAGAGEPEAGAVDEGGVGEGVVDEADLDGSEPEGDDEIGEDVAEAVAAGATVADFVNGSCSTATVFGLSKQIVAETNCLVPGALSQVPDRSDFVKAASTFPFMQTPARNALVKVLDADGRTFSVNSMLRTVAQQYLLFAWFQQGRCGIQAAARPGKSNHETGLALDTSDFAAFRSALESRGFRWFGNGDRVHFDFVGAGTKNLTGTDVRAFQRLWNLNNPGDKITVDGLYGPQTESRLRKSPAAGFAKGSSCGGLPGTATRGARSMRPPRGPGSLRLSRDAAPA